jgi:hypothetical protein
LKVLDPITIEIWDGRQSPGMQSVGRDERRFHNFPRARTKKSMDLLGALGVLGRVSGDRLVFGRRLRPRTEPSQTRGPEFDVGLVSAT